LLAEEGEEVGEEPNHKTARKINHSILSVPKLPTQVIKIRDKNLMFGCL
jgi:hypothetical protein